MEYDREMADMFEPKLKPMSKPVQMTQRELLSGFVKIESGPFVDYPPFSLYEVKMKKQTGFVVTVGVEGPDRVARRIGSADVSFFVEHVLDKFTEWPAVPEMGPWMSRRPLHVGFEANKSNRHILHRTAWPNTVNRLNTHLSRLRRKTTKSLNTLTRARASRRRGRSPSVGRPRVNVGNSATPEKNTA